MTPPAVIVHGLTHVRLAQAVGHPFCLLSAPGAATTLGVPWWRRLAEAAGQGRDILDCGRDGGAALEALRAGQRDLVLRGPFAEAIARIVAGAGGQVLAEPPVALDLGQRGAERHLAHWLGAAKSPPCQPSGS